MSRRSVAWTKQETERNPAPAKAPELVATSSPRVAIGTCPKCLRHFGRAMRAHAPYCKGDRTAFPGGVMPTTMINDGKPVAGPIVTVLNPEKLGAPFKAQLVASAQPVITEAPKVGSAPVSVVAAAKERLTLRLKGSASAKT